MLPRYPAVCLAFMLYVGVCLGQQPEASPTPAVPPSPAANASSSRDPENGAASAGLNSLQGIKIALIQVNSQGIENLQSLLALLPQKVNEPLDKYKVRQSVQVLYNTGRFADIQVEALRNADGELALTFVARENFFFGSILSEGSPAHPSDNQLVNASKLNLGEKFTDDKIKIGIQGMQRTLQENGYYQATIVPSYQMDPTNQQVKVQFVVDRGKLARVGVLDVTGSPGYTKEEIYDIAKIHPGDQVTVAHLTRALQRLRKRYQKKDRLEAQVTSTKRVYHPESNLLDYTFDITRGPTVDVKVEGAKLRGGLVKKFVPIYEENAVDEDLLNEGARNIRDYFQTKGYFAVKVSFNQMQEPGSEKRTVVFTIEKNDRHKFVELVIRGNRYFHVDDLRERMQIQPAGGILVHGLFSQSLLVRDVQSIEALYHANGFRQVKVSQDVQDNYEGNPGHIRVTLDIDEGPQTTVGKLTIEGNQALPEAQIRGMISAGEGQPYSDSVVISDQTEVMNEYFDLGFPNVKFEYTTQPEAGDATKIDVSYKIFEGAQAFVDQVLISGLRYTKPFVVEREMKLRSGDRLSQSQMLGSQRRLYDMGIFNEVNIAIQNPDGDATQKNVNFQISEAKRYTFNYGFGMEVQTGQPAGITDPQGSTGVSGRVSFDITRLNFRGRDHTIILKTRYGNLEKLALVGFEEPRWFDSQKLSLDFTTFYQQTNDVRTFTAKRLEGSASIKQIYSRSTTLLYRFTYRRVSTDNLVIDQNLVPLFSRAVRVGMPDLNYVRDTRDNPIDSRKGSFSTVDIGVAAGAFGSQASFGRLSLQNSTYYPFHKKRWVFARSTRIGVEQPFGSTSFAPLPERFFSGGSTSHRGFGINQAGPRDLTTGFPLGGEALFVNNLELRTPPVPLPFVGNNLGLAFFHDMGNVFSTVHDMANSFLKYSQPDRNSCLSPTTKICSFNYVAHAVGAGVRYHTPIGPVSFDLGYNLNPPAFPITAPPPPALPSAQVLKHFNFFFNIGQTF